jgi:hypothetical protein
MKPYIQCSTILLNRYLRRKEKLMNHKYWLIILTTVMAVLLIGAIVAVAQGYDSRGDIDLLVLPDGTSGARAVAAPVYTYTTVITVTSGADPDDSLGTTCSSQPICTLRRAIVESRSLAENELPVLIRFDIPASDASYDSGLGIWKIEVYPTTDTTIFRRLKSRVIIDGDTQPGGRVVGPKIIIFGPGTGQKTGLVVGENSTHYGNTIRGLGFQNLRTHLTVNSNNTIIEENWFGLNDAGTAPYLRNDDPEDGSGSAGISFNGSPVAGMVRDNVFLGFDGVAAAIRGEDNVFESNLVGTRADGSVTKQTDPNLICTTVDWLGGGGVSIEGVGHRVENNVFAALRQEIFQISTQPEAIGVDGDEHVIQNNKIGLDLSATEVGVCGRGVYLSGANTPDHTQVFSNTIVNPELSAISINGSTTDANTLKNNVIKKATDWPQIQGNPEPEDAIQFGPSVPDALRDFLPAKVTKIEGTTVSGTSGTGSPCPNCTIELFLDDKDTVVEALQRLAVTTADSSGDWTATLPSELTSDQGIRTTSTTAQFNTIPNMSAGTTTKLSDLYTSEFAVFLPMVKR